MALFCCVDSHVVDITLVSFIEEASAKANSGIPNTILSDRKERA